MTRVSTDKKTLLIAGAAAVILLGGGGLWFATRAAETPAAVEKHAEAEGEGAAPEGVVALTAEQIEAAGIQLAAVSAGGGGETRLAGRVEPMIDARAAVAAAVGGRVERVLVAPGQTVRAGQPLAVLVSGEAAVYRAEIDAASASADAARRAHQRDQNLYEAGVVARQDVEASRASALGAEAQARAARARAAAAGSPSASGRISIVAPISGVVTSVQVGPGGFLAQGAVVAEVADPARVELVFSAPPDLATGVRAGETMRISGSHGEFEAVVTGVAAAGGENGATVIRARPSGGALPPAGSPVTGTVVTGRQEDGLAVPSDAVQVVEGGNVVFVRTAEGFRAVPVMVGRQAGGRTEILNGLKGGETIAGANAFLLKAEMAKGEAEHGH